MKRLGSCGALIDVPVGTVVTPQACVSVNRNVDFNFRTREADNEHAYRVSKPVSADLTVLRYMTLFILSELFKAYGDQVLLKEVSISV